MPDRSDNLDQLNRALDRIAADQPAPVLDDPDLENLAQLAGVLRRKMPKDTPDPHFRSELKMDLTEPHPKLVSFPARHAPRRYPVGAFAGALLAVLLSSVVVGWMALSPSTDNVRQLAGNSAGAPLTPTSVVTATTAAVLISTTVPATVNSQSGEFAGIQATTPESATPISNLEDESVAESSVNETAAVTEAGEEVSDGQESKPAPTEIPPTPEPSVAPKLADAELPPVDQEHLELGALATIAPISGPVAENVKFILRSELPDLQSTASVYRFTVPNVEASMLVQGISRILNINSEIEQSFEFGKMIYTVASESSYFSWSPSSGAFSCKLGNHEPSTSEPVDVPQAAFDWLRQLGYPVDTDLVTPLVEQIDSGDWRVTIPLMEAPNPALGHPLAITLLMRSDGAVLEASGYWLKATQLQDLAIVNAEQAWQALLDGRGYWTNSFSPDSRGEFVVESFDVKYVLTRNDDDEVVLQPVVSASGSFHDENGNVIPDQQVLIQAAATTP